jgi:predicted nuclease of predicted toxin-antitoxin system
VNSLVDARLPRRLAYTLRDAGHDDKLLLILTGNITNADPDDLFTDQMPAITTAFESYEYLGLRRDTLIFHS